MRDSLTQVKEDSHLKLLMTLSSSRGGMQRASSASLSGQRCGFSSTPSLSSSLSSSHAKSSSQSSRGTKHPASSSSSPSRVSKVTYKGILRSPWKKSFRK